MKLLYTVSIALLRSFGSNMFGERDWFALFSFLRKGIGINDWVVI